jgi:hypothetical protein
VPYFSRKQDINITPKERPRWDALLKLKRLNQLKMSDVEAHGSLDAAIWRALENGANVHRLEGTELPFDLVHSSEIPAPFEHLKTLEGHFVSCL